LFAKFDRFKNVAKHALAGRLNLPIPVRSRSFCGMLPGQVIDEIDRRPAECTIGNEDGHRDAREKE